jgi:hypothetical protein
MAEKTERKGEPISLSTMLGLGAEFEAAGKKYTVKPLKLKDVEAFSKDNISLGAQLYNILNKKARDTLDKWLSRYVFNEADEGMTVEKATADDWDLGDLKRCVQRLLDISG